MKTRSMMLAHLVWTGLVLCGFQGVVSPAWGQQVANAQVTSDGAGSADISKQQVRVWELPDSPGAVLAKVQTQEFTSSQSSSSAQSATAPQSTQPQPSAASPQSQNSPPAQRPVGTAAAESSNVSGIAASQPAGVAIAPAKQRRVRTIVLRMGAIIGAGAAVGTVVALTAATPSKPPGAH